jgi:hypothetical protein
MKSLPKFPLASFGCEICAEQTFYTKGIPLLSPVLINGYRRTDCN